MPNQADSNVNKLDYYTKLYGFSQLINSPTRVTTSTSTIIDLIFVSDPVLYTVKQGFAKLVLAIIISSIQ